MPTITKQCDACDGLGHWEDCTICWHRLDECDHEHPDATNIVERECDECGATGQIESDEEA